MNADILFFFRDQPALSLYEALEARILAVIPEVTIKVSKTQISFSNKYGFAFVSFIPCRKAANRPESWITVSFGLDHQKKSARIDTATEPYPNRWTHHIMVGSVKEIDDELVDWICEAAAFSAAKR